MSERYHHTLRVILIALLFVFPGFRGAAGTRTSAPEDAPRYRMPLDLSLRVNLVWAAASEPNIGFEVPVGQHVTLGANLGLKAWPRWGFWDWDEKENDTHWRNFAVVPEIRWWPGNLYEGWFAGADFIYTHYNVGAVSFPFGMYPDAKDYRLQGSWWAGGIFGGYSWALGEHFRLEAEAGVAAGLAAFDRYDCKHCGTSLGEDRKVGVVPKVGVNIAWNPVSRTERAARLAERTSTDVQTVVNIVSKPVAFVVHLKDVPSLPSAGDKLAATDSWVVPVSHHRPLDYQTRPGRDSVLCIRYAVDSDELNPELGGNAASLEKLVADIRAIRNDARNEELLVSIVGLASIEGPVEHNDTLSVRRARAVAQYLEKETGLPHRNFEVIGKGEAWDWLRAQLAANPAGLEAGQVEKLNAILDESSDPDVRERRIRSDAALYNAVKTQLLADQRTAGYIRLYYGDRPDPVTQKLNDEVYALLNAKRYHETVQMVRKDAALMERVQSDAEAANAYGIALYFTALDNKDTDAEEQAIDLIKRAARQGSDAAIENLKGIETYGPARKEYDAWVAESKKQ